MTGRAPGPGGPATAAKAAAGPADLPDRAEIDCSRILSDYPGLAVMVDAGGRVRAGSGSASLAALLDGVSPAPLRRVVATAIGTEVPQGTSIEVAGEAGPVHLQVAVLPLLGTEVPVALVLAQDESLAVNLRTALVDSRQRYKDLVECSSDVAWETDAAGAFVFVSPRGALGRAASALVGHDAAGMLDARTDDGTSPFTAATRVEDAEVSAADSSGRRRRLRVSAVPLYDRDGLRSGARGVWRDVTDEYEREAALREARRHEVSVAAVVSAIHNEPKRERILAAAAEAAARALEAAAVVIHRRECDGRFRPVARFPDRSDAGGASPADLHPAPGESAGECLASRRTGVFCSEAHYVHAVNGMLCVTAPDGVAWSDADRRLVVDIAAQLGIAIAQSRDHERLRELSRTDPLTGLLNRGAFVEEAERRIGEASRGGPPLSVLYLDLNNFKAVNDRLGHQHGDAVLRALASLLRDGIGESDLAARIGGDEFVLLLGSADIGTAEAAAKALAEACRRALEPLGAEGAPLGVAVGVSAFPDGVAPTLDAVLEAADDAMYRAKALGGFSVVAATAPR